MSPATGSCQPPPPGSAEGGVSRASKGLQQPIEVLDTARFGALPVEGQVGTFFALLDGAAVAVMPLDLYREMVTGLARALPPMDRRGRAAPGQATAGKGSTVERDVEVAAFLRDLFPRRLTVAQLRAACLERFGAERTPSLTRISVFRRRVT